MIDRDWKDLVIETGVDNLLNYLVEEKEAPVSQISEELGVAEDQAKTWAEALDEKGFLEKNHSARKGMILKYTDKNQEKANEKLQKMREEVEKKSETVKKELETRKK
ncbi:MAG: hypothetical protein BRC26_03400, partial [Nanohaloarchaea archaeon QH_8_44_6]